MRLLMILATITVLSEAKKRRPDKKKTEKKVDEISNIGDDGRYVPVPFGHIFKEGFQPYSNQPIDLLEYDKKYPEDLDELREKINKEIQKKQAPKGFASPKDAFIFSEKALENKETELDNTEKEEKKEDKNPSLDLAGSHARNLAMARHRTPNLTPRFPQLKTQDAKPLEPAEPNYHKKEQYFSRKSFGLGQSNRDFKNMNWTKCSEFGRNADFHPDDVINIDWVPFYSWSSKDIQRSVAYIHKFSNPTIKIVQKYKEELGPFLNNSLNWDEPKLYLKADMEMLLVAADRRGQFIGIPYNEVPSTMKGSKFIAPTIKLRLKIVDPYLAMMFCDVQYATIMAVSGNEPTTINDIRSEAATLKFNGRGYPVARDLEEERLRAKFERESKIEREKNKYIEPEEMVSYRFPFE